MQTYPLQEGEEVLWAGTSQRPRKWFPEYTQMIAITGLVVFLIVLRRHFSGWSLLVGAYVVLFGLLLQRASDRRARDRAMSYLVTSHRIIFVASWPNGTEFRWAWLPYLLLPPRVKADASGVGTISFGGWWSRVQFREKELRGAWAPPVLELRAIADAANVAKLIVQTRHRAATTTYTQAP
ncbi:hypothetical protein BS329_39520 [Amycolatopsis coloradensis]|uniref:Uncharacterized protein n=1 Tax=Amycolatopsis coloradensis TaxID=76021 RepID=A0A1R0KE46_9PSEU|nr:hypothetical protein [Amycolatopsis coloradensis]OLZ43305.1 hypothetical protein BS329_39520 [Amycolatopsis coloradensis]